MSEKDRPDAAFEADAEEVRQAHDRGRAAFPDIDLDETFFAGHLSRVLTRDRDKEGVARVSDLAAADLYLVAACLAQLPTAVAAIHNRHGATIRQAVDRTTRGRDAGEIEQQIWDVMLVGSIEGPPRIDSYAGRAPLDRWLQVAAQRMALMWLRSNKAQARAHQGAADEAMLTPDTQPEVAFFKKRYRGEFSRALEEALGRVAEEDRTFLRLSFVNGLSIEKIGKMFGVSQPTASRRLAAAREAVLEDVKASLERRLGTSSSELASMARLVASRLDVSLSQLLRPR